MKVLLDQLYLEVLVGGIYRYLIQKVLLHKISFAFGPQFENVRIS